MEYNRGSLQVKVIDSLPDAKSNLEIWFTSMTVDELDASLVTLLLSLLTVLYLRQRHRQVVEAEVAPEPLAPEPPVPLQ